MTALPDERDLLERLKEPGQADRAFGELVGAYGPVLHRHLLRMLQSSADVDDVLQNTLVKIHRNLAGFRGDSKLSTWLYRIATNEALSWLRSARRRQDRIATTDPASFAAQQLTADPYFDGHAAQLELQKALATLPDKQRAVFSLRYFDELSYREISSITGTTEGGLKASYHLAVKKITQKLKAYAQ